ncbi:MAG: hypothetical protein IIB95_03715 [Candidatus Marinimicrobia bacterium]|nr:hypothetical protein [Candidatus Neomarinimicrobiota bacterium]MCH7762831.1 hypothetical protein [Candidatus Neomarinimicrobiota bacterium]
MVYKSLRTLNKSFRSLRLNFKYLFLITSVLFSQNIIERPYDWSGQYGTSTVNSRLLWNSDWTSGPLLFDGTYTFYPQRYGEHVTSHFALLTLNRFPLNNHETQDTSFIKSTLDYKIGDYNYDQLTLDLDYNTPKRHIGLHGFKRSYAGRRGQFFHPRGMTVPLQQSYTFDYISEKNGWLLNAAAARFVTESGLPDTSLFNGLFEDEILTAGLLSKSPDDKLQWTSHLALFQQWRRVDVSWYSNRKSQYINRSHWHNQLDGFEIEGVDISFGLDLNIQSVTQSDTVHRQTNWATSYTKVIWNRINVLYGGTFFDKGGSARYFSAEYSKSWKVFTINAIYSDQTKPTHIRIWEANHNDEIERFIFGVFSVNADFKNVKTGLNYYNGVNEINNSRKGYVSTVELYGQYDFLKTVSFKASYSFQKGNYYLSDGIGNRVYFQLNFKKDRFFNRFDLSAKFYGEGLLNKEDSNLLSPLDGIPLEKIRSSLSLSNIWLLHFDVSATISTMTITWSVRNIFQALEPYALKIFPNKEVGDFQVQYNSIFPPMGRIVMFNIHWTFED